MFSSSISVDQISHMTSTAYSWNPFENPDVGGLVFRGADISSEIQRVKLIWLKQSCCNLPYVKQTIKCVCTKWYTRYPLLPSDGFPLHKWHFLKNPILNPCGFLVFITVFSRISSTWPHENCEPVRPRCMIAWCQCGGPGPGVKMIILEGNPYQHSHKRLGKL